METYGKKQASLDIFRMLLLNSSDADLNYGMGCKLVTEEDVLRQLWRWTPLECNETAKRIFRGRKRMGFLKKLRLTVNMMRKIRENYEAYPNTPEGFSKWQQQTLSLMNQAKMQLGE